MLAKRFLSTNLRIFVSRNVINSRQGAVAVSNLYWDSFIANCRLPLLTANLRK